MTFTLCLFNSYVRKKDFVFILIAIFLTLYESTRLPCLIFQPINIEMSQLYTLMAFTTMAKYSVKVRLSLIVPK